jgi:hypothetical protein
MNKPIISTYQVKLTCDDILAEVHYAFWKGMPSGDYDVPGDSDEVEISRILINNVDMSNVLFEIAEDWTMMIEEEILLHCQENY